eukprot:8954695-Lingulodinium_polyedra.AAC.1
MNRRRTESLDINAQQTTRDCQRAQINIPNPGERELRKLTRGGAGPLAENARQRFRRRSPTLASD